VVELRCVILADCSLIVNLRLATDVVAVALALLVFTRGQRRVQLQDEGYAIMPVSSEDQLKYGCNCLNLGAGRIVSVHEDTARQIVNFEGFKGHVQFIDWSSITSMYGAVHCGTQVIVRAPLPEHDESEGTQRGAKRIRASAGP
jgi:N-dimethylarginine dimethylaminohydrolase